MLKNTNCNRSCQIQAIECLCCELIFTEGIHISGQCECGILSVLCQLGLHRVMVYLSQKASVCKPRDSPGLQWSAVLRRRHSEVHVHMVAGNVKARSRTGSARESRPGEPCSVTGAETAARFIQDGCSVCTDCSFVCTIINTVMSLRRDRVPAVSLIIISKNIFSTFWMSFC